MSFLHNHNTLAPSKFNLLSTVKANLNLFQVKKSLLLIKVFVLLQLTISTAIAGQIAHIDFESGSLKSEENGFNWKTGKDTSVSSKNAKSGKYSLKFTYKGVDDGKDSFSEQGFKLGGHYPDLWVKYDIYIPGNYRHRDSSGSDNNKGFLFIWAGTYGTDAPEGPKLGQHFWHKSGDLSSASLFAKSYEESKIVLDKNWNCSDCGDGKSDEAITQNDKGHWMTIVIHAKYASSSNNDGVYETWKTDWQGNTVKLINVQDGPWYSTMPDSTKPARGFDQGYLLGWANSGFDEETIFYIDNLTFSTTPLSTDSVPDNTALPNSPSQWQ